MTNSHKIKLTYFDIEAAAEKVRLTLTMCGQEFEDVRLGFADWPAFKANTPYGQMPVMEIDGQPMVAQSPAMMRWAARKFDTTGSLYPVDADQCLIVEELTGLSDDMARAWTPALYMGMGMHTKFGHPEDWTAKADTVKAMREKFILEELPRFMGFLQTHLDRAGGDKFLCGDKLTIADLQWLPQLRYFTRGIADHVPADCLDKFPGVKAWVQRMLDVPQIKAWYKL